MRIKMVFLPFVLGLLCCVKIYADECPPAITCGPCGTVSTNATNLPADAVALNPLLNYTASAETCVNRGYFGGFYVGAAYGLGSINYDLKVGGGQPFGLDQDARSYLVTIFNGGFNLILDYFFLGIEGGYNYRSQVSPISYLDLVDFTQALLPIGPEVPFVSATNAPCRIRLDINSYHAATADLLPGFVYQRFVGYLRLGVESTTYDFEQRVCFPDLIFDFVENAVFVAGADYRSSIKKSVTGYRLGAGFGIAAGPHVSFHLNYIHTFGKKIGFNFDVTPIAERRVIISGQDTFDTVFLPVLASETVIEPQRDEVNFGVKFRF